MSKKLTAMERIELLVDEKSFLEIGGSVRATSAAKDSLGDGVITGYGTVNGRLVYVVSQDPEKLGGSLGVRHIRKMITLYELALKTGAPVVGFLDSNGFRLAEAEESISLFGDLLALQSKCKGQIPLYTGVFGQCGGAWAVSAAMADFLFVGNEGSLFLFSENAMPKDESGKIVSICDGIGEEAELIGKIRCLIDLLPAHCLETALSQVTDDPNRLCPDLAAGKADASYVFSRIADSNLFVEVGTERAPEMVTGFLRLAGITVAAVGNCLTRYNAEGEAEEQSRVLTSRACRKASRFIDFCNAYHLPLLTYVQVEGYQLSGASGQAHLIRAMADMSASIASADVPKITLMAGKSVGPAYSIMSPGMLNTDFVLAYADASFLPMEAGEAARILFAKELAEAEEPKAVLAEKQKEYEERAEAMGPVAQGRIHRIIAEEETRQVLASLFDLLWTKREEKR